MNPWIIGSFYLTDHDLFRYVGTNGLAVLDNFALDFCFHTGESTGAVYGFQVWFSASSLAASTGCVSRDSVD